MICEITFWSYCLFNVYQKYYISSSNCYLYRASSYFLDSAVIFYHLRNIYEPLLLGCEPNGTDVQEEREKAIESSKAYLKDIETHFGKDWCSFFDKDVEAKQKELNNRK